MAVIKTYGTPVEIIAPYIDFMSPDMYQEQLARVTNTTDFPNGITRGTVAFIDRAKDDTKATIAVGSQVAPLESVAVICLKDAEVGMPAAFAVTGGILADKVSDPAVAGQSILITDAQIALLRTTGFVFIGQLSESLQAGDTYTP